MNTVKPKSWLKIIKEIFLIILLILFGLESIYLFDPLGPGEKLSTRIIVISFFYLFLPGVVIHFMPEKWKLGAILSWGSVLCGLMLIFGIGGEWSMKNLLLGLVIAICPLFVSLAGSQLGKYAKENDLIRKQIWKPKK